ncbi:hypothetical protein BXZ70DRAFT_390643 [Cristinia sonorae]|uniref:Uncharacterized protein n=1 Tax=Cristinia sonorae TaxID=1940300 RepID=A0A8K0UJI0_9AGAR|nr:hypothetical protein BXZ70DRAFT_390643 [Cristinia sonorae]
MSLFASGFCISACSSPYITISTRLIYASPNIRPLPVRSHFALSVQSSTTQIPFTPFALAHFTLGLDLDHTPGPFSLSFPTLHLFFSHFSLLSPTIYINGHSSFVHPFPTLFISLSFHYGSCSPLLPFLPSLPSSSVSPFFFARLVVRGDLCAPRSNLPFFPPTTSLFWR